MSDFTPRFGVIQPTQPRFYGVPTWDAANPVLPESQWEEHDDLASVWPEIEAQQNNNCTNAALAHAATAAFTFAGIPAPRFSWASNYARHNNNRDSGAMCRDLAWDFKNGPGLLPSNMWPDSKIFGGWTPEQIAEGEKWRALEIYQCMNFAHVASALTRRFAVYHGFCLGQGGVSNPRDGRMPEFDGQLANGHAMASRGLTKKFGDWRTITPNTWGKQWADNGVGYWPASYFWLQRSNFVNLDCFAIRAVRHSPLPEVR